MALIVLSRYFNPRSHEGSDAACLLCRFLMHISIHAPTRGATFCRCCKIKRIYNFNPRSHEGSDLPDRSFLSRRSNFNPRSHEGSDIFVLISIVSFIDISIHAPTRGATRKLQYSSEQLIISIHAPTRGATTVTDIDWEIIKFQSTLPRGERRLRVPVYAGLPYFNPRSHEGSDRSVKKAGSRRIISIHAPTRGATKTEHSGRVSVRFQSTLPRGERLQPQHRTYAD